MVDDQRPRAAAAVRVGIDVLDAAAPVGDDVIQPEVLGAGVPPAIVEERRDLGLEVIDVALVRLLVAVRPAVSRSQKADQPGRPCNSGTQRCAGWEPIRTAWHCR